jgi:hypothetical protein
MLDESRFHSNPGLKTDLYEPCTTEKLKTEKLKTENLKTEKLKTEN